MVTLEKSTNSVIVATTELLTEVGLMKSLDPERRQRLNKSGLSYKLEKLYFFLKDEIKKESRSSFWQSNATIT